MAAIPVSNQSRTYDLFVNNVTISNPEQPAAGKTPLRLPALRYLVFSSRYKPSIRCLPSNLRVLRLQVVPPHCIIIQNYLLLFLRLLLSYPTYGAALRLPILFLAGPTVTVFFECLLLV